MTLTQRVVAFGRSRAGSALAGSLGLAAVLLLLHHAGPHNVWLAITRSVVVLPLVFLGEGAAVALEACSLRRLYGDDRERIPVADVARSTMIMYAVAGLAPAGRPVGEGVRAAMLARWTSGVKAAAAAAKQQSVLLIVQAAISIPCIAAAVALDATPIVTFAIVGNCLLTLVLGSAVLLTARNQTVARWLGRLMPKREEFGEAFHRELREPIPAASLGFAFAARLVQATQYTLLLLALGNGFSLLRGLLAEGAHLVGATIGDLIPSHVGATEANFQVAARALSLSAGDALAIPIVVHAVQLLWIAIGSMVPLVWSRTDGPSPEPEIASGSAR